MSKTRALVLALLTVGSLALMGVATWTRTEETSVKAFFTVGNEGIAGPTASTDGLALSSPVPGGLRGFSVVLEAPLGVDAAAANLVPAGVYLRAWVLNPNGLKPDAGPGGWWTPAPELDLGPTKGGKLSESWHGFRVTAPSDGSRLAYLPNTFGGACTVYINGVRAE